MHALDVNTTPITTFTNHKSQNGKIKVYIQMRRQQEQWEGKEKNQVMNFVPYWGYQLNKTCCSLSLFLPPQKTEKTMHHHHHNSYRSLFPSQIQVHTDIHTYPFFTSASEWCVCVCVYTASFFYSLPLTLLAQSSRTRIASTTSISFPKPTKLECSHHFFFFSLVRCC